MFPILIITLIFVSATCTNFLVQIFNLICCTFNCYYFFLSICLGFCVSDFMYGLYSFGYRLFLISFLMIDFWVCLLLLAAALILFLGGAFSFYEILDYACHVPRLSRQMYSRSKILVE